MQLESYKHERAKCASLAFSGHKTNPAFVALGSLITITLSTALCLSVSTTSASIEVVDQTSITVPIACTMTGEGTSHTATLDPGTYSGATGSEYENGIGKTTLTAICNDDNGFSIYAIGYTGNQYEGENHTKLVGQSTNSTISTKAYASGDTASNWSMKLTKITDPAESYNPQNLTIQSNAEGSFETWHSIPNTNTKVAEYHANTGSSTTDATLGVKLETTYAAYISSSQPADTYVGQVKYTMVHPYTEEPPLRPQITPSGKICYYPNGSNVDGTMGCQNVASSVTLLASNFSRTGYGFAGWSNKFDYATNPNQEGIKFYGPNETISLNYADYAGEGKGLSLYAVWIKSQGSIQNTSKVSEACNRLITAPTDGTANLESVAAFTDSRDNNTYAIAKLADGKCWMIENLRLDNTAEHNSDGALAQGYDSSFIGLADAESEHFTYSDTTANSLYTIENNIDGKKTISGDRQAYRFPRYNNTNTSNRASSPAPAFNSVSMYSYGNYYTWHAAIADTTDYYKGDHNTTSICPTGWRLPLGDTSTGDIEQGEADISNKVGGFSYLDRQMGGTGIRQPANEAASLRWRKFPNNFLYSGYFVPSYAYQRSLYGHYWSSTTDYYSSFILDLSYSGVDPARTIDNKTTGNSIRCIIGS